MTLFSKPTARALAILDLLMANPQRSFGLTEMTRKLNLNKATCHAIVSTMNRYGYLVQHPKSKAYRLGPSIVAASAAANAPFPAIEFAKAELEALATELDANCITIAHTTEQLVLLSHHGKSSSYDGLFHQGLRLPFIAPLGSCFIAWSPAKQLQQWLNHAHQALGQYNETLDQAFRISVIGINARGFEVTLKTKAEQQLSTDIAAMADDWDFNRLQQQITQFHSSLCEESFHLDHIDPSARYSVSHISAPIMGRSDQPEYVFAVGNFTGDLQGNEIINIARQLLETCQRVSKAALAAAPRKQS